MIVMTIVATRSPPNPPRREPEVPAEEVPGDNGADTQCPQGENARDSFQLPFLEIVVAGLAIGHAAAVFENLEPVLAFAHANLPRSPARRVPSRDERS